MASLVVRRGMAKLAAAEDGPTFEQQFGILSNALIAEKYPKLDNMKLAFQLIEKDENNANACGAAVYMLGNNVVFIPSFYKNGKIKTGDMMFLAETQQFIPLSDPWLAWLANKELKQPGKRVEKEFIDKNIVDDSVTVKDVTDPITKTASVIREGTLFLKGVLRTDPDLTKHAPDCNVFDAILGMGKTAAATMLDNLVESNSLLNAALRFYDGDALDGFAKKAAAMNEPAADEVSVVLPFTKEASELSDTEKAMLLEDGYVIRKTASAEVPDVIEASNLRNMFKCVSHPGMMQLLTMDGDVKKCLVLRKDKLSLWGGECCCCEPCEPKKETYGHPGPADSAISTSGENMCALVTKDAKKPVELSAETMMLVDSDNEDFKPEHIKAYGVSASPGSVDKLGYGTSILCPNGTLYIVYGNAYAHNGGWYNTDNVSIVIGESDRQIAPMKYGNVIVLPKGSRIIQEPAGRADEAVGSEDNTTSERADVRYRHAVPFVQFSGLDAFLTNYTNKNYRRVKVSSNGTEFYTSGEKSDMSPMSVKEASLHLVRDYGIDPDIARQMLRKEASCATSSCITSTSYLLSKTAADPGWEDATVPDHQFDNIGPQHEFIQMPSVVENPAQLQQAIERAAENGIKEVFDVTAFKLMLRQNRFLEEIHDDLPMFMEVLNSLCRKLFLLYWHTDAFEDQYGTVKLKSLEDSLKTTIDSLSDITIFFKMRTVDGDNGLGNDGGDLMGGHGL